MKSKTILASGAALAFLGASVCVNAQNLNGTLDSSFYNSPLAVQTINTSFGNSAGGGDATGSELDAGYGRITGGNLYLFLSGAFQDNGNHLNIFIGSSDVPGQNTLNIGSSTEAAMNGSVFSPGFSPNYMIDANDYSGTLYVDGFNLPNGGTATQAYLGSITGSSGIFAYTSFGSSLSLALNNTLTSTMGTAGDALSGTTSGAAATTGMELVIPLSTIGNPSGSVMVMADINGGSDGYLSNQLLPGLPVGSGSIGTSTFDFSSTPGQYFTVAAVPEPASMAFMGFFGLASLLALRRKK